MGGFTAVLWFKVLLHNTIAPECRVLNQQSVFFLDFLLLKNVQGV